jgi:hypothetical protein
MCRPEDFPPYEPDLKDLQVPTELPEANEVIKALDQMAAEWVTSEEERIAFHTADVILVGHLVRAVRKSERELIAKKIRVMVDDMYHGWDTTYSAEEGVSVAALTAWLLETDHG